MKEPMKALDMAMEALACFSKHLGPETTKMIMDVMDRRPRMIVDATDTPYKHYEISVPLNKDELTKGKDEVVRTIINPACFHMAERVKKLGYTFNTFVRLPLPENCESARTEDKGISIIVIKDLDTKEGEVLKIAVRIAEDSREDQLKLINGTWAIKCGA